MKDKLLLIGLALVVLCSTMFSGCVETSGISITEEELGPGLTRLPDGRIAIDPGMFKDNLIYDGYNLSAVDLGGSSGGSSVITTNNYDDHFNQSGGTLYTETDGDRVVLNSTLNVSSNTDVVTILGRGKLGFITGWSDDFVISHYDQFSNTDFALMQDNSGQTYLNCDPSKFIYFTDGGVNIARLDSSEWNLHTTPILWGDSWGSETLELTRDSDQVLNLSSDYGDVYFEVDGQVNTSSSVNIDGMTLTGSSSEYDLYIKNSNGKYWTATGANIETAYAATTAPGWVKIPPGTFTITDDIDLRSNVDLIGSGKGRTIIKAGGNFGEGVIVGNDVNNWTVRDLTIDGNNISYDSANGIDIDACDDWTIQDVSIYNTTYNGIRTTDSGEDGDNLRGHITRVDVFNITYEGGAYQSFSLSESQYLIIENCFIDGVEKGYGINMADCHHVAISDIVMTDVDMGIKLITGTSYVSANNVEMDGDGWSTNGAGLFLSDANHCTFNNIISRDFKNNVYVSSTSHNSTFNNILCNNSNDEDGFANWGDDIQVNNLRSYDSNRYGIYNSGDRCKYTNFDVRGTQVSWNGAVFVEDCKEVIFDAGSIVDSDQAGGRGFNIDNTDNVSINNVQVKDNANHGIHVSGTASHYLSITDCTISHNGGDGVWLTNDSHNFWLINDNIILGNTGEAIDDDSGAGTNSTADNLV